MEVKGNANVINLANRWFWQRDTGLAKTQWDGVCLCLQIWVKYATETPDQLTEDNMLRCEVNYLALLTAPVTEATSDPSSHTAEQQRMIDGKTEAKGSGNSRKQCCIESIAWSIFRRRWASEWSLFILLTPWSNHQHEKLPLLQWNSTCKSLISWRAFPLQAGMGKKQTGHRERGISPSREWEKNKKLYGEAGNWCPPAGAKTNS